MATILLKRGTQAQVLAATGLTAGETLMATDTGNLFSYNGTAIQLVGKVLQGLATEKPVSNVGTGQLYWSTDTLTLSLYSGSAWIDVGTSSLDNMIDGTYAKVLATEVGDGLVTRISDGTNTVNAEDARTHLDATTIHREQDDALTGTTTLWSSSKTKDYADSVATGLSWKNPVRAATAGANVSLTGIYTLDTVALNDGDRVLVKDQSVPSTNGIYVANSSGAWVRSEDANTSDKINRAAVIVRDGSALNKGIGYVVSVVDPVLGTDDILFTQFTGAGSIAAGTGINITGNTVSVRLGAGITELPTGEVGIDLATGSGLELTPGSSDPDAQLKVKLDTAVLEVNASGEIGILPAGITATQLSDTVAGAGLTGGDGTALSVIVDNATIEVGSVAGDVRVKDAGITEVQINTSAIGDGLTGGAGTAIAVGAGNGISVAADDVAVLAESSSAGNIAAVISVTGTGVAVKVDNTSIVANGSSQLEVSVVDGGTL